MVMRNKKIVVMGSLQFKIGIKNRIQIGLKVSFKIKIKIQIKIKISFKIKIYQIKIQIKIKNTNDDSNKIFYYNYLILNNYEILYKINLMFLS